MQICRKSLCRRAELFSVVTMTPFPHALIVVYTEGSFECRAPHLIEAVTQLSEHVTLYTRGGKTRGEAIDARSPTTTIRQLLHISLLMLLNAPALLSDVLPVSSRLLLLHATSYRCSCGGLLRLLLVLLGRGGGLACC